MHIPENYLSPATCAVMTAAMVPVWAHAVKKVQRELPKEKIPMLGVGAAFSFVAMMFNVPLIGGTTGHAVGGTLIALLFGPDAACIAVSIALLLQAVIFGDGGILSFGANCFNMAFILPYTGWILYRLMMKLIHSGKSKDTLSYVSAGISSYIGINLAAFFAAIEFGIQPLLFRDAAGNPLYCPYSWNITIPAMMLPHLAVAGFVEAAFTVAVFAFVLKTSPELANKTSLTCIPANRHRDINSTPLFALLSVLIAATPLGLLASGSAWGEWSAEEIADVVTNGETLGFTPQGLANGWSLQALLPDYSFKGLSVPETVLVYILSAVLGAAILIIIFKLISLHVKGNNNAS